MLIFDKGYMEIRNKYILPLSKYTVPYKSLKNTNIKDILNGKFSNVKKADDGKYILYFDEDILMKALLGDIELLYIRMLLQENDIDQINKNRKNISPNWNIVTNYYFSYFAASLFLRLCFRGNIFVEKELKKTMEFIISEYVGEIIVLDSNMVYEVLFLKGEYVLKLSTGLANTHELVWKELDKLIREIIMLSRQNSDEYLLLDAIKDINQKLGVVYPSQLRNRINYQMKYGIECLEKKIYPININEYPSWIKELLNFNIGEVRGNDTRIANVYVAYSVYIKIFAKKLIAEYYELRGNQNGIIKKMNTYRNEKIIIQDYPFSYDI